MATQDNPGADKDTNVAKSKQTGDESEDEDEESEILEESPCGRWVKRREEVQQRDVPGIDVAYLAMDTEEGVEVVWNEVKFSERKNFKAQEDKIKQVFDNLTQLEHANIVKFHKYWCDTDRDAENPRVIFITEYMSSGSLKKFLQKTKKNNKTINAKSWKRWCTQILSALSYLHSCDAPIIHGNLTCDTIFIQHNGLIKIGSVAPDAIHQHVKTCRQEKRNMYYIAPEYGAASCSVVTPAVDIYALGICVLEMATLGSISSNGEGQPVTETAIQETIHALEDHLQQDFILKCIEKDPTKRPTARQLLLHKVLVEVHSLRLVAAHKLIQTPHLLESLTDESFEKSADTQCASLVMKGVPHKYKYMDFPFTETLDKFIEDVKIGIYPLTLFETPGGTRPRAESPEVAEAVKSDTPDPDVEVRRVTNMQCKVHAEQEGQGLQLTLLLKMEDKMNRELSCKVLDSDSSAMLAEELVHYGFINETDREALAKLIDENIETCRNQVVGCTSLPLSGSDQALTQTKKQALGSTA